MDDILVADTRFPRYRQLDDPGPVWLRNMARTRGVTIHDATTSYLDILACRRTIDPTSSYLTIYGSC
jgi:hypothetical protein